MDISWLSFFLKKIGISSQGCDLIAYNDKESNSYTIMLIYFLD